MRSATHLLRIQPPRRARRQVHDVPYLCVRQEGQNGLGGEEVRAAGL
ncbi:hypothetical protein [Streptomyces sp. 11x1]|nr:hypothetical protein [Streptomyces sp. 11x1]WNZ13438.1 hypothetical protein P8T65_41635 [Streptomyces sp. 11x1]